MNELEKVLYWILLATTGGSNRGRILDEIMKAPQNANVLSKILNLDFKTIQHHIKVLEKNKLICHEGGDGYGKVYFPSELLEENLESYKKIWSKIKK